MSRPSPAILSRDAIIDVAWRIIDAEGADALSMRRLARDLGVKGPSLYHHFASKSEILDGIVARVDDDLRLQASAPDWEGIITEFATQLRAMLTAHPHIVEFVALRPVKTETGLHIYERMVRELTACGWPATFSRDATLAVETLVFGAALTANAPDIELSPEQRERFPMLAQTSDGPPAEHPDDGFRVGFAAMIAGLSVLVADPAGAVRRSTHRADRRPVSSQ